MPFRGILDPPDVDKYAQAVDMATRTAQQNMNVDALLQEVIRREFYNSLMEAVASGPISVLVRTSQLLVSGTTAYTLADGVANGQLKILRCRTAVLTPVGTVTPATAVNFTAIRFTAINQVILLEWHPNGWLIGPNTGVTIV